MAANTTHRARGPAGRRQAAGDEIRSSDLAGVFAVPQWLRELGTTAWLLVGITGLLVGVVWLLALTDAIVVPVLTAAIIAAVLSPLIGLLERHGVPRALGAAIVFLVVLVGGVLLALLILGEVAGQSGGLRENLRQGAHTIRGWLEDAGVSADRAQATEGDASAAVSSAFHALVDGVATGIGALASVAVFVSFAALSLFLLLKDGPVIRDWAERHMGVPHSVARAVTGRTLQALRGYFAGVTAVAAFNAIVIGGGAVVLDVPHAGSIAVVNFMTAYIPYLGAWSAGAFTVLIALGAQGPETALAMAVIALLANGALQQVIQPIAFGATLDIHPLAVLIVTIAAGSLFGTIGLVLAAPLTSAALRVSADLAQARAREEQPPPEVGAAPAP